MNSPRSIGSWLCFAMLCCTSPGIAQADGAPDTRFVFRLLLFAEGNRLGLAADVSSTATYPCAGFGIKLQQFTNADTITIRVGGVLRPNPCFQAHDVATSKLFVGPLRSGRHILRISYRGAEDLYVLIMQENRYTISALKNDFTEIEKL